MDVHRLVLLALALTLVACRRTETQPTRAPVPRASAEPVVVATDPPPATRPVVADACQPLEGLEERRERDLFVPAAPLPVEGRSYTDGDNVAGHERRWVGPPVPASVPLYVGDAELSALTGAGDGFLAEYRTPVSGACRIDDHGGCKLFVKHFDRCGTETWTVELHAGKSKGAIGYDSAGILYRDGVLYFNEVCDPADVKPKGRCGALVAMDPTTQATKWRTAAMVSSSALLAHDGWIVTVYQYLGQRAHVHVLRASDREIALRQEVEGGLWDLEIAADGHLQLAAFGDSRMHYVMTAWDTAKPRLTRVPGYRD